MTYMYRNKLKRTTHFFACYSLAIGSALGIAFADNLLTLFIFYEILSFSTYPLIIHSRSAEALKAGWLYLLTLVGTSTLFLLTAIIWIGFIAGTLDFEQGGILRNYASATEITVLLLLVVLGTAKAAIMPLHRWLPSAMVATCAGQCLAPCSCSRQGWCLYYHETRGLYIRGGHLKRGRSRLVRLSCELHRFSSIGDCN